MATFRFQTLALDALTAQPVAAQIGMHLARRAVVTVGAVSIRYRYDGGLPGTSTGHLVAANGQFALEGADAVRNLKLIATATTSTCFVTTEAP